MWTRNNKQLGPLGRKSQGPAIHSLTYRDPPCIEADARSQRAGVFGLWMVQGREALLRL